MKNVVVILFLFTLVKLPAQNNTAKLPGLSADTSWFDFRKADFNSPISEFGIVPYNDGYVFTTARTNDLAVRYFSSDTSQPLLDLYYVHKSDSDSFSKPVPFSEQVNSRSNNEGPGTFTNEGSYMVLTGNSPDHQVLALYASQQERKIWSKPQMLPFCEREFNYVHPSFCTGDSILFFASDMRGGFGGMDIYFVKCTNGQWLTPVNAGAKINSPADEVFPFCSASGNLYFSSKRDGGLGGLDLYVLSLEDSAYLPATALVTPLNSAADDFGLWISTDNTEGFISSNRNNRKSDDDIYAFRYEWPSVQKVDTLIRAALCYSFFEEATTRSGDTAMMKYIWVFSDGEVGYGYAMLKCFDTTGAYGIHLTIRDSAGGDVVISEREYDFEIVEPNYVSFQAPDSVKIHQQFSINTGMAELKGYEIQNVFYDFGNGHRGEGKNVTHQYHQPGSYYPKVYFLAKNRETGTTESRCVVKHIIIY